MPTGRAFGTQAVVDNVIYTIGGLDALSNGKKVEAYDPASDTWTAKTSMSRSYGRVKSCGMAIGKYVYVVGGQNVWGSSSSSGVDRYDPSAWSLITSPWRQDVATYPNPAAFGLACVQYQGKGYFFGGSSLSGTIYKDNFEFNVATNTFAAKKPMPTARVDAFAAVVGNKAYVVGGWATAASYPLQKTEIYDFSTDTWSTGADIPSVSPRSLVGGVVNNKIYVVDGVGTLFQYDPLGDRWTGKGTLLNTSREGGFGAVVNGKLYVMGGRSRQMQSYFLTSTEEGTVADIGDLPTPTSTATPTSTPTPTITLTPTATNTATPTPPLIGGPMPTPILTPTPTYTATPTPVPSGGPTPTYTPTPTPSVTYSITGRVTGVSRVTDVNSKGIGGVTVSAGAGRSAVTNDDGSYTLGGLPAGSYTLTPSKVGYTFPRAPAVSLPAQATGQDFVGYDRDPIVFVHGWNGLKPDPKCNQEPLDATFGSITNTESVAGQLYTARYYVEYADIFSSYCYTPPIEQNVSNLKFAIDKAKSSTGSDKVILIAHSMGGLVARAYVEGPNYANDVSALFTFGTPHLGIPFGVFARLAASLYFGPVDKFCLKQPGACEMADYNMWSFNQRFPQRARGVDYHLISGHAGWRWNVLYWITAFLIPGPHDGIVPTSSGTGLAGLDRLITDEVHTKDFGSGSYFVLRDGGQSKSFLDCLMPVLVVRSTETCWVRGTAEAAAESLPTLAQQVPLESSTLLPGQPFTRTIPLGSGPALFATTWQAGTLTVRLIDPANQRIDAAYASSHPDAVSYQSEATAATYYITSTVAGAWQLVLEGTDVPAQGTAYTTFASFDSDVALAGATDNAWYTPGASASIIATLSGSPDSAAVTATIIRPDAVTDTLPLAPLGGDQYSATYAVPAAPGYAEVRLAASGATGGGDPFQREVPLVFQIASTNFALSGVYSDTPQPRWPGSSSYKALTVNVGINALVSGKVSLSADLASGDGKVVAHGVTSQTTMTGTATLGLRFDADSIYASQRNGPYTLTNLLLTAQPGSALVVSEAQNVYATPAYDYRRFGKETVFLPLVARVHTNGW